MSQVHLGLSFKDDVAPATEQVGLLLLSHFDFHTHATYLNSDDLLGNERHKALMFHLLKLSKSCSYSENHLTLKIECPGSAWIVNEFLSYESRNLR